MGLVDSVFERKTLSDAFDGVIKAMKSTQSAHVRDPEALRQRIRTLESTRDSVLDGIVERRSREGTIKFSRIVTRIPKKPGHKPKRPISLFSFEERVILRAVLQVVWPYFEVKLVPSVAYCTFRKQGLHPTRGIAQAVQFISRERQTNAPFVFETDIRQFFDNIDREQLLLDASGMLSDDTLNDLLRATLYAETVLDARFIFADGEFCVEKGVPQGAALSPLLACMYLSPFDMYMKDAGFEMLRYVDDFVVLGGKDDCERAEVVAREVLRRDYGLDIHPDARKTRQVSPEEVLTFLGHEIHPNGACKPSKKRKQGVAEHVFRSVCGHRGDFGWVPGLPQVNQTVLAQKLTSYLLGYFISMEHCDWSDEDYSEVANYIRAALRSKGLPENRLSRALKSSSSKWPRPFVEALP